MEKKCAVITGGSRGIGHACALTLSQSGYNVIINYRSDKEAAESVCSEIRSGGGNAEIFCADVSKSGEARRLISKAVMEYGGIDLLVNNAGISSQTLFLQTDDDELARVTETNYYGAFYCARAAAKEMLSAGKGGVIVNISSMWGICGAAGEVAYSASKAAVIGLTKALAKELAPSDIRVNCIAPGVINTEMNACYPPETLEELKKRTPLGRLGEPRDVASVVRFLASEEAGFITGQVICADGGFIL